MKKLFSVIVAVFLLLISTMAFAQTNMNIDLGRGANVNTNWNGVNGWLNLNANLGPAGFTLYNGGSTFQGIANMTNSGDNPYGYGVDSTRTFVSAGTTGNGFSSLNYTRTASYSPMYGPAGQNVQAFVGSDDTGNMALTIKTNYAALGIGNYGQPGVPGGGQFAATGNFYVSHSVTDGAGNWAGLENEGNGSTRINAMSSDVGGSSFNFGAGQGCYTNATVVATGNGFFGVGGEASNYLNAPGFGITLPGGGTFNAGADYNAGLNVTNFSINGH